MKSQKFNYMIVLATIFTSCAAPNNKEAANWPDAEPPVAAIKPHHRTIHGDTVLDNYYWLNDFFKKGPDSAAVIAYLEEENAYTAQVMKDTEGFQAQLFEEMKARIKEKEEPVTYVNNGYYYYHGSGAGRQYYKGSRKKGSLGAKDGRLLDVDATSNEFAYYAICGYAVSPDNKF